MCGFFFHFLLLLFDELFDMKNFFLSLVGLFSALSLVSQRQISERVAVQLISPQKIYLNGGARAAFGGQSRTWIQIILPENTVEWYYAFSTGQSSSNLGLFTQLAKLTDPKGNTSISEEAVYVPSGSGVCDVLLLDKANADAFYSKVDLSGGTFFVQTQKINHRNGLIRVKHLLSGDWYIGLRNPSSLEGVSISLEAVAIVQQTRVVELSESQLKAEMFGNLGWKAYEEGEFVKSLELSKKAIEYDPKLGWIHCNIGLVHLILGDYVSAIESYSTAIPLIRNSHDPQYYFIEVINDLEMLVANHPEINGVAAILEMLNSSLESSK